MSQFQHFALHMDSDTIVEVRLEFHEKWKVRGTIKTQSRKIFQGRFLSKIFPVISEKKKEFFASSLIWSQANRFILRHSENQN